ncbi:MAG: hypothetical protein Q9M20_00630 [Mariprofundaceae bacterium]|nr:hypothetical protein [Mariprofundaceae bacterium]
MVIGDFYFVPAVEKDKKETLEKEALLRKNRQLEEQLAQMDGQSAKRITRPLKSVKLQVVTQPQMITKLMEMEQSQIR